MRQDDSPAQGVGGVPNECSEMGKPGVCLSIHLVTPRHVPNQKAVRLPPRAVRVTALHSIGIGIEPHR